MNKWDSGHNFKVECEWNITKRRLELTASWIEGDKQVASATYINDSHIQNPTLLAETLEHWGNTWFQHIEEATR